MFSVTEALLVTVTVLVALFILKWFNEHDRRYPPSLPALPLVGSLPFLGSIEKLSDNFAKKAEKLGPVISFYIGRKLAVVLNGKEAITEALTKNGADFSDRFFFYTERKVANPEQRGVIFKYYDESFRKYQKLTISILKGFGFGVKDVSERLILDDVAELLEEIRRKDCKSFDIKEMLTTSVSNTVLGLLFGKRFLRAGSEHKDLLKNLDKHTNNIEPAFDFAPLVRFIPMYRKKLMASAEAHVEMRRCIAEGIRSGLTEEGDNFVKKFIELEGPGYDREELFYILRDVCSGSTDTVSTTILWAIVFLANNPKVQDRLQKETDSVIPKERLPSLDDKQHMPYTEAFMLEILRFKCVIMFVVRVLLKDKKFNGYFIPKDTMVIVNLRSAQMDPKVWNDPKVFRPERFLDNENQVIGRERMMPFSLGKRSCPGESLARKSLFLFLAALCQHFNIHPPEGQDSIVVSDICTSIDYPSAYDVRLIPR